VNFSYATICRGAESTQVKFLVRYLIAFFCMALGTHCSLVVAEDNPNRVSNSIASHLPEGKVLSRVQMKNVKGPLKTLEGWVWAQDDTNGGCLLVEGDGRLHVLVGSEVQTIERTSQAFIPYNQEQMAESLKKQLPADFKVFISKKFVIAYNTTEAYAKWNASIYERLFRGFYNYWKSRGLELKEPEFPLVAILFEKRADYLRYAEKEEVNAESTIGYYNQLSNRMAGYDLTGIEGTIPAGKKVNTPELINAILNRPAAERTVATIVHEAVHQLAYNSGLQTRMADNPIAISEGLAMFFESPDLSSSSGWGGIGKVNLYNFNVFRGAHNARKTLPLISLIESDATFKDANSVGVAYGESWALCYFLMKTKSKEFTNYLMELASRPPMQPSDPKRRLNDFHKHFGNDIDKLERDFLKYLGALKP
jgi:Protein of unknown function (DUF1570)